MCSVFTLYCGRDKHVVCPKLGKLCVAVYIHLALIRPVHELLLYTSNSEEPCVSMATHLGQNNNYVLLISKCILIDIPACASLKKQFTVATGMYYDLYVRTYVAT